MQLKLTLILVVIYMVLAITGEGLGKETKMMKKPPPNGKVPKKHIGMKTDKAEMDLNEAEMEGNSNGARMDADPEIMDSDLNTEDEEGDLASEEGVEHTEEETSKKSVKNFTCQVTGALLSMANSIKELNDDIKSIKEQMFQKCPNFNLNQTQMDDTSSGNRTDEPTDAEDIGTTTTALPPIPTQCDEPFRPVASSCYYFLYYTPDWKNWGDANAYCKTIGGTLAAPYRPDDLRTYLIENFSDNVFWVGVVRRTSSGPFEWLTGTPLGKEDWKKGHPGRGSAKYCVYLEPASGYRAVEYFCGEKFPFVCEKRA